MDAYDLVRMEINPVLSKKLGFARMLDAAKEVRLGVSSSKVVVSTDPAAIHRIREGIVGILFADYSIGGKLLAEISDNDIALYIAVSPIISGYGIHRSRQIFKAASLFDHSEKKGVRVGFVSFAGSPSELCSRIQLLNLAKLISEDDSYARRSISETNSLLLKAVEQKNNI
jgi:hypothetical protein